MIDKPSRGTDILAWISRLVDELRQVFNMKGDGIDVDWTGPAVILRAKPSDLFVGMAIYAIPPGNTLSEQLAKIPSGWHFANGSVVTLPGSVSYTLPNARGRYFVGFDDTPTPGTPDADYDKLGVGENTNKWEGFRWHGQTENNHPDHNVNHGHGVSDSGIGSGTAGSGNASYAGPVCGWWDNSFPTAGGWDTGASANVVPAGENGLASHWGIANDGSMVVGLETVNLKKDTDNRPPSCVAFALVWVGIRTVNGVVPAP